MSGCPYAALGLRRGAGSDEIKKAYKALVVEHHPDKHVTAPEAVQAAAAARFKTIQEAYQLLSDERKRSAYEASRSAGAAGYGPWQAGVNTDWTAGSRAGGGGGGGGSGYTSRMSNAEFLRRAARQGVRSLDQPLHIGLAVLLVGGVILFDFASNRAWELRNRGKRFEDIQQRRAAAAAAAAGEGGEGGGGVGGGGGNDGRSSGEAGSGGGSSGPPGGAGGGGGGGGRARSAWLDGMRGRDVGASGAGGAPAVAAAPAGAGASPELQGESSQQPMPHHQRGGHAHRAIPLHASPPGQMAGHGGVARA